MPNLRATVSAIIPNHNHGKELPDAIAALLAQTAPPFEIIIIDDGSTDDSRAVIARLQAADDRILAIFHDRRRGAIAALNTGIEAASGSLIYLGAADDVTLPNLFERLSGPIFSYAGIGLASAELRLVEQAGRHVSRRPAIRPAQTCRVFTPAETRGLFGHIDNFIMTGAALLNREFLLQAGGLRPELGSFADGFVVRQLALRHGFAFLPETLAEWRVSASGLSRKTASDPSSVKKLLDAVIVAFATDPAFPANYANLFARRWKFGVLRLALGSPRDNLDVIATAAPDPLILRGTFVWISLLPLVGRPLALAWATLVYRPFSILAFAHTAVRRRWP